MKYMVLMQGTQSDWDDFVTWGPDDIKRMIAFMDELNNDLQNSGELVTAEGLDAPETTKVVQVKGGQRVVNEGPFPATKEFLVGWWILDCATEERVLEIAERISAQPGKGGEPVNIPVEIRPVGEAPEV